MQDPNIFGCKIFRESMFWGLNFTLHMQTPYTNIGSTPLGVGFAARAIFQDETKNSAFLKMTEKDLH